MAKLVTKGYPIIHLDKKDQQILYELDKNSRISASKIAQKTRLSKDVVNYRIKRLLQLGVINKFLTIFDTAKLGYTTYKFFIKLHNTSPAKEKEIINRLVAHRNTQFVITTQGVYDLIINVLASSPDELDHILGDINTICGEHIAKRDMLIMVKTFFFFRDYFIGKSSNDLRKNIFFGSKPQEVKLDPINKKIISLLANDARIPVVQIAKMVNLSPDSVIARMKKLERAQIISNYIVFPNSEMIGYTFFKLLFHLNNYSQQAERELFTYCKHHQNIWWWSKSIGLADLEINIDVASDEELKHIIQEIKEKFHHVIRDITSIQVTKTYKFNLYPMGATE